MKNYFKVLTISIQSYFGTSKSKKWHSSDWKILLNNSDEYIRMMNLALQNNIYSQVLHNGHIAVELLVKSAISRQYGKHPDGHEIRRLIIEELNGTKILLEINIDPVISMHFNKIYTAWKMQYRYQTKSLSQKEADLYLSAFKEAYKWIKNKYCQ